ncbi:MAG: RNA 2'-phosphotransferase [Microscillaceae bacterium]|nr:RNA 2'-phosphotransferase [Microscillaceae bacterium]
MLERQKSISKRLSLALRHRPALLGITLDAQGWTDLPLLLKQFRETFFPITEAELQEVVATNPKNRFEISTDGQQIRARQGHSVAVQLDYSPQMPPEWLYHGTARQHLPSIRQAGLLKQARHHVHLSGDKETALTVGQRHGSPVVLLVKAQALYQADVPFYLTGNGVWLVEAVPPDFLIFPEED